MIITNKNIKEAEKKIYVHDYKIKIFEINAEYEEIKIILVHNYIDRKELKNKITAEFKEILYFEIIAANFWGISKKEVLDMEFSMNDPRLEELKKMQKASDYDSNKLEEDSANSFFVTKIYFDTGDVIKIICKTAIIDI